MTPLEAMRWAETEEGLAAARTFLSRPGRLEGETALLYAEADRAREKGQTGRLAELEKDIVQKLRETLQARREIETALEKLADETVRKALRLRYVEEVSSCAAAMRLFMDERQYFRLVRRGCFQVAMELALGCGK